MSGDHAELVTWAQASLSVALSRVFCHAYTQFIASKLEDVVDARPICERLLAGQKAISALRIYKTIKANGSLPRTEPLGNPQGWENRLAPLEGFLMLSLHQKILPRPRWTSQLTRSQTGPFRKRFSPCAKGL